MREGFLIVETNSLQSDKEETLVRIFASYDMGWSQRGNGYAYDSLNGYCALIGLKSGKILDYCTRNRKCRICEAGQVTGKVKDHDCRLNFYGSSKSMEADGAVQLVAHSNILKNANVEVGVFIGDNDSCSMASLKNAGVCNIIKQSDMNHTSKGVGNILHEVHNDKKKDPDRELSNEIIKHLQRCFTYAIKQNLGNVQKIQASIGNIPYHVFDHHENCGDWCQNESEKENLRGIRLKNAILFEVLKKTFFDLSANAQKFAAAASSQANESLNNSMCSKAPKRLSYSTSESSDYRFACTVAQKNLGPGYLKESMDNINMTSQSILSKYVRKESDRLIRRKENASKPLFKRRRLQLKAKRSQLRNRRENAEGDTYKSNMGLLENETCQRQIDAVVEKDNTLKPNDIEHFIHTDFAIVFFDLETGGFELTRDILQISMKSGESTFNCYITPTSTIDPNASKIHGVCRVHKQLFQHGKEVNTKPRRLVFDNLLDFLKKLEKMCILVAHNCRFDSTRIVFAIKELNLLEEYRKVISGFSDTLHLFRQRFPNRTDGYKLTSLASELSLSCNNAHDAQFDVTMLEKLTISYLNVDDIIRTQTSIDGVLTILLKNERTKALLPSFEPMKHVISTEMQKRLASSDISYEALIQKYKTEGEAETIAFLRSDKEGKPQLIKNKKIMKSILDYLKSLT